jgi:hypothetical protein
MGGDWLWAQAAMARQEERGRMLPLRVFSREMSVVGQAWMSVEVMVWVRMSERVRWWLLEGVKGIARAPLREARKPASLWPGGEVSLKGRVGGECGEGQEGWLDDSFSGERGEKNPPADYVTPGISDYTVRWSSQMCSYTQLIPHRPTNHQQRSRKTRKFSDKRLQVGRVFVIEENVVAKSRAFDGCKHRRGGARRYIAFGDVSLL